MTLPDLLAAAEQLAAGMGLPGVPSIDVLELGGVEIVESGESLVVVDHPRITFVGSYRASGVPEADDYIRLRSGAADRLVAAAERLGAPFGLAVYDAFRSMATVRVLYDLTYGSVPDLPPGFVADPTHPTVAPAHSTGGAVDLTLSFDGVPLDLGTAFDEFVPAAAADYLERSGVLGPMHLRRLLYWSMIEAGFVNFPPEWWHYSFGDQEWAAVSGAVAACYGTHPFAL